MRRLLAAVVVGGAGLYGLYSAAGAGSSSGYTLGLLLFAAGVGCVFWMLKQHYDGVPETRLLDIWPQRPRNGWLLLLVLGVLGLVGLFLAAGGDPYLYWFGLSLFVACCVMALMAMKTIYDRRERH
jgi:hypothetical protein